MRDRCSLFPPLAGRETTTGGMGNLEGRDVIISEGPEVWLDLGCGYKEEAFAKQR